MTMMLSVPHLSGGCRLGSLLSQGHPRNTARNAALAWRSPTPRSGPSRPPPASAVSPSTSPCSSGGCSLRRCRSSDRGAPETARCDSGEVPASRPCRRVPSIASTAPAILQRKSTGEASVHRRPSLRPQLRPSSCSDFRHKEEDQTEVDVDLPASASQEELNESNFNSSVYEDPDSVQGEENHESGYWMFVSENSEPLP